MKKLILYSGFFRFPDGDAAGHRVKGIGRLLNALNYQVEFIGISESTDSETARWRELDGFRYCSIPRSAGRWGWLGRIDGLIHRVCQEIHQQRSTLKAVILYNAPAWICREVQACASKFGLPVIGDITEWYSPRQFKGGVFNPFFFDNEIRMRYSCRAMGHIIAISDYLESYYSRSCSVVNLPPMIDLAEEKWRRSEASAVREQNSFQLGYAGTPGRKDNMELLLAAMLALKQKDGILVILNLYGPVATDLLQVLKRKNLLRLLSEQIVFHGRVTSRELPGLLQMNDFTFLFRPVKRYSTAGFPTKFVESMAAGVPVIANLTSNLGRFLQNGKNGIVIDGEKIEQALRTACALTDAERSSMRENAYQTAVHSFDYRNYIASMTKFMSSLPSV